MAEYCKDCFKKLNPQVDVHRIVMSREMELCEGCGQLRPCVVRLRKYTWWARLLSGKPSCERDS